MNPIDFLLQFFRTFDEGQAFLPTGTHVHKIATRGKPTQVWTSEVSDGVPVCQGNVNFYGVTLLEDGFVLYAEINTDSTSIQWQAVLEA